MSEINRDKVREHIRARVKYHSGFTLADKSIDDVLFHPNIAIVNRGAELPLLTDDWIGEGWVKEIKE